MTPKRYLVNRFKVGPYYIVVATYMVYYLVVLLVHRRGVHSLFLYTILIVLTSHWWRPVSIVKSHWLFDLVYILESDWTSVSRQLSVLLPDWFISLNVKLLGPEELSSFLISKYNFFLINENLRDIEILRHPLFVIFFKLPKI